MSVSSAPFRGSVDSGIAELFGLLAAEFQGPDIQQGRQLQCRCRLYLLLDIVMGAGVKSYPPSSSTIVEPVDDGTAGLGAEWYASECVWRGPDVVGGAELND